MGCDIHMFLEAKVSSNGYASWKPVTRLIEVGTRDMGSQAEVGVAEWYPWRNYWDFSQLADVRNTDKEVTPIAPPRGLPEDASGFIREEHLRWESDAHSSSYFTTEELKGVDWLPGSNMPRVLNEIDELFWAVRNWPRDPADIRLVFWFDN